MPFVGFVASGLVSGSYYIGGGTINRNTLKTNKRNYITFTAYLTEMHERVRIALQIKRPPFFSTARRSAKLEDLVFDSGITFHSNTTEVDTATATPCGPNNVTSQLDWAVR
jgi:hypothetical protein